MKNLILVLATTLLFSTFTHAQNNNLSVGITGGVATALGNWGAATNSEDERIRFIKPGSSLNFSLAYQFPQTEYGLIGLVRRQINTVDTEAMVRAVSDPYSGDYFIESDDWGMSQFMLGAFRSVELTDKLSLNIRVMTGLMNIRRPLTTYFSGVNYISEPGAMDNTLTYLVGAGLDYRLTNNWSLLLNVDYSGGNPTFRYEDTTNIDGYSSNTILTQRIHSLNLNLGIAVKF